MGIEEDDWGSLLRSGGQGDGPGQEERCSEKCWRVFNTEEKARSSPFQLAASSIPLPCDPAVPSWAFTKERWKQCPYKHCKQMFAVPSFLSAWDWASVKCPSPGGWLVSCLFLPKNYPSKLRGSVQQMALLLLRVRIWLCWADCLWFEDP